MATLKRTMIKIHRGQKSKIYFVGIIKRTLKGRFAWAIGIRQSFKKEIAPELDSEEGR